MVSEFQQNFKCFAIILNLCIVIAFHQSEMKRQLSETNSEIQKNANEAIVPQGSSYVTNEKGVPGLEPIIESVSLAQLRARCRSSNRYSDFDLDSSVQVKPSLETPNLMNHHLQNLYTSQMLCDLTVVVGDRKYNIHKIALTSHSEKYLTMFVDPKQTTQYVEISLEGVSHEIVEQGSVIFNY